MSYTSLSLREAIEKDLLTSLTITDFDMLLEEPDELIVRIYEGDTVLPDYVDLYDLFLEEKTAGIIVNGNLTVNAPVIDFELDTYSCFLIVNGSLTCTSLVVGCAEVLVDGDVNATEAVLGYYNHGLMEIGGNLNARILLVEGHSTTVYGNINAATYCPDWHIKGADFTDWNHILLPEVAKELLNKDGYLSVSDTRLIHLLKDQQPVFKQNLTISADNNPEAQVTTWKYIKPLIKHLKGTHEEYPFQILEKDSPGLPDNKFILYNGTTVLDELDLDIQDDECLGIIVVGDLHIKGSIINEDTDNAMSLIVLGNLKAKNVCVGGQLIYITGNITVEEMLLGIYNHGELISKSYVWCPAVINRDYHYSFADFAGVKVLNMDDDDDTDLIKELFIDDLFEWEEEGDVFYSVIRSGQPLLKPVRQRNEIKPEDLAVLLNIPLFGPDNMEIAFNDNDWHITINRGKLNEDGDNDPSSIIGINTKYGEYYFWYFSEENTIESMIKVNEEWVSAPAKMMSKVLSQFTLVETLINRKVQWNNKHVKEINKEQLWQLIWLFRQGQSDEEFEILAREIFTRVLYAASHPFAYIFAKYPEDSEERGLAINATWTHAAALLDGLIATSLAQEISADTPLAEQLEKLDTLTEACFGFKNAPPTGYYKTNPIDRDFICALNKILIPYECAVVRLDVGISTYILAGMYLTDIPQLTPLMQMLGIFPKHFSQVEEEEENALKQIAIAMLATTQNNEPEELHQYRVHEPVLWGYLYNERGQIHFWNSWADQLKTSLTIKAGSSYTFRGDDTFPPIHPEMEFWIDWLELYEYFRDEGNVIMPEEEDDDNDE